MLARTNRLLTAADIRGVLRRGRRHSLSLVTVSTLARSEDAPARFGFVITKKVGNAVVRNRVRRRLKAAARGLVDEGFTGVDVVARVLPAAANGTWNTLRQELVTATRGGASR